MKAEILTTEKQKMKEEIIYNASLLTSGGEYCTATFSYSLDT